MNTTDREILARGLAQAMAPRLKQLDAEQADNLELIQDLQDRLTVAELTMQGLALRLAELEAKQ
ncbi:hypothetical protein [Pseudomonas sp.]|uniref:hypothetical protein n=1 Tax=Pseudomonas sp. TaxID=306 RepID=UPI0027371C85|nr:hypothetical protein [Pseudomonas sp.]MDP3816685.1 hypothetical protein [Pseudomonas sp.]